MSHTTNTSKICITSLEITSGNDSGMPVVDLQPGQAVTYYLDSEAKKNYKFQKPAKKAITLVEMVNHEPIGPSMMSAVKITRDDDTLTVEVLPTKEHAKNVAAWSAKATLFFKLLPDSRAKDPAQQGLDPVINNMGSGSGSTKPLDTL